MHFKFKFIIIFCLAIVISNGENNSSITFVAEPQAKQRTFNDNLFENIKRVISPGGITYRFGGRVLTGAVKVNIIYYGTWSQTQINTINYFISYFGSTSWFNIQKYYYSQASSTSSTIFIGGPISLGSYIIDSYSGGTVLASFEKVAQIINSHLNNGRLLRDPNAIYILMSSRDVQEGAFCTKYCGYHSFFNTATGPYLFAFVGNPARCPDSCLYLNKIASPNLDVGVDGAINIMAREIAETMTNPYHNAWFDLIGYENADKCSWEFGSTYLLSNGAYYNIRVGSYYFLIQSNWDRVSQRCVMSK